MFVDGEVGKEHVVLRAEAQAASGLYHIAVDGVSIDACLATGRGIHSCHKQQK